MAHQSLNSKSLCRTFAGGLTSVGDLGELDGSSPGVYVFLLPLEATYDRQLACEGLAGVLRRFCQNAHSGAVVVILTSPPAAATLSFEIGSCMRFQLWVAVKLREPIPNPGQLPRHHAALVILSRYKGPLRHAKTRIAYTYCPFCQKTTKDYGGKKHTYHEYGTLMSDVWRDMIYDPEGVPQDILTRLQDLFGIPPYEHLTVVDLRKIADLRSRSRHSEADASSQSRIACEVPTGLVKGDCLEALRAIPSRSVDFCFADPPYNLRKKYDSWDDTLDISRYFQWCDRWLGELARVLKPGRTCAVINIPQWAIRHFWELRRLLAYQSWIVWEGLSLPVRMIMPAHYSILCFTKGEPRPLPGLSRTDLSDLEAASVRPLAEFYCLRSHCVERRRARRIQDAGPVTDLWWDIHRLKHNSRRVDHPCQLPPALMRRLIALFTYPSEVVLDPFNGAGTTTLAAEQLGRRFVGVELSGQYHALAVKRHAELRAGLDPFRKTDSVPNAKNSRVKRLEKQRYAISKKALQLEVKRVAKQLGHLPSREELACLSAYPIEYYDKYFISWGEVRAAARTTGMSEYRPDDPRARQASRMPLFERST